MPNEIKPGMEVFRKTDHGFQKVQLIKDYTPGFPAVRVRTLDKAKHEWLIKPSEVLTVAEKQARDEIDYANHHPSILAEWKSGVHNRTSISLGQDTSYRVVSKVIKFGLRHNLITK